MEEKKKNGCAYDLEKVQIFLKGNFYYEFFYFEAMVTDDLK